MAATTPPPSSTHTTSPPKPPSPRFTLELEFVLSLSNPYYLSHLALNYPHLLHPPKESPKSSPEKSEPEPSESDASKFASYLSYLYKYWRTPEYARFLTHPGAALRNLELMQQDQFRRDIIRPDVIENLLAAGSDNHSGTVAEAAKQEPEESKREEGDQHMLTKEGKVQARQPGKA